MGEIQTQGRGVAFIQVNVQMENGMKNIIYIAFITVSILVSATKIGWTAEETMKGEGKDETFYSFAVGCSAQCVRGATFTPLTCTASGTGATCTSDQQTRSALCTEPGPPASGMACNCTGSPQTIGGHLIPVNTCSSW